MSMNEYDIIRHGSSAIVVEYRRATIKETPVPTIEFTEADERAAFSGMTDRELTAYWNIMQFPGIVIGCKTTRHLPLVADELTARGIPHQPGALTEHSVKV